MYRSDGGTALLTVGRYGKGCVRSHMTGRKLGVAILVPIALLVPVVAHARPQGRKIGATTLPYARRMPAAFRIVELKSPGYKSVAPVAENNSNDVVGDVVGPASRPFEYSASQGVVVLRLPEGFANASGLSISNVKTMAIKAWNFSPRNASFFVGNVSLRVSWQRLRSYLPGFRVGAVAGVASDGAILGTVVHTAATGLTGGRAAIWFPISGRYARPTLLPVPGGYSASSGSAIWSKKSNLVAAGCIYSSGNTNCLTFWGRVGEGGFKVNPAKSGGDDSGIAALGGAGSQLFAGGATGNNVDPPSPWASRVMIRRGRPWLLSGARILPVPPGEAYGIVTAASSGASAKLWAVGRAGLTPNVGVMWLGSNVLSLQRFVSKNTGWQLDQPDGINASGQVIGTGLLKGNREGFVLKQ